MDIKSTVIPKPEQSCYSTFNNQHLLCNLILDTISDAIILLNKDFEIIYQNNAVERITGFTFQETNGMPVEAFVLDDDKEELKSFLEEVAASPNVSMKKELRAVHKNKYPLWVEGSITNMINDQNLHAYVVNYRDVSERKKAETVLQNVNSHLEEMVKERTSDLEAFTHSVSHDLRAPVRAINGLTQILNKTLEGTLNETSQKILNEINSETKHMNSLIDDLLRLCQSGSKPPMLKLTDMNDLVQITLRELTIGNEFNAKIEALPLPKINCDAGLMLQVWSNLISNALKYSAKCSAPEIEIGCREGGVFYVKDNGAGFNMKYAPKLFNVFQRLHSRNDFEGTGVGLSLVKRVIDKHGGEIWVEAAEGKGATFFFTLSQTNANQHKDNQPHAPGSLSM